MLTKIKTQKNKKKIRNGRKSLQNHIPHRLHYPQVLWAAPNPQNLHPLRPIVLSRDSVTYVVAKVLAKKLRPLVGKSPHHIQCTKDSVHRVSKVTLLPRECLSSYDVTALFTSVPIDPTLNIIKEL